MIATRAGVYALTLVWLLLWGGMAVAGSAKSVTMYELTENMKRVARGKSEHRVATSQLTGFADLGSPLCPAEMVAQLEAMGLLPPGTKQCTINMSGSDNIDVRTGLGPFLGMFHVVVQGDNLVDSPELVVLRGKFRGQMDFSPALVWKMPYGMVSGNLTIDKEASVPFTGTFRLPFLGSYAVPEAGGMTLRQLFCPASPAPNYQLGGPDITYIDTTAGAPNGKCIDVLPNELSLGFPTVRFDAEFE